VGARLVVNGQRLDLGDVDGSVTLLEALRSAGQTGCKEGCAEGECGACAVLIARPDGPDGTRWTAINACLVPAAGLDGQEVVTAEGLGTPEDLHPVQREMADRGGSQCGYCTPGFICAMAAEYYRVDRHYRPGRESSTARLNGAGDPEHGPNGFDLHALSGNLCRCTGYRPIRDAAYALGQPDPSDRLYARQRHPAPAPVATSVGAEHAFVRPDSLAEALELLAGNPEAQLVAGSTDWGVELNLRHARAGLTIAIDRLAELRESSVRDDWIELGAALTLSELERGPAGEIRALAELFEQFASRLIRNGATLGGNLGTASPIGDAAPALLALDAWLVLTSTAGERTVPLAEYFTGYRQSVKRPDELIRAVRIPTPVAPISAFHKIAKRRFDDISGVAIGYALRLAEDPATGAGTVAEIRIGLGGVAATPLRAREVEAELIGRDWNGETVWAAAELMARAGTPISDHRASADYRRMMLRESLLKFHAEHPAEEVE
jgi:xanthine dehydrogenase small subunit